jgi:S-DNA-T family DNA segregation ATPase FtsK/SpoIIIE
MIAERTGSEPRPILPDQVGDKLPAFVLRLMGAGMLGAGLLCWLALLSWSARDPSLTHAAGGVARNWAGPIGAVTSDLLLQTLGFAALFGLLAPAVWGFEMIATGQLYGMRRKVVMVPFAVLMLAGGLSALPAPPSWPLHHGLGGMLGDVIFRLAAGLLAMFNPGRAGVAAGLVLLAGGMAALASGLGISYQDFDQFMRHRPRLRGPWWAAITACAMKAVGKGSLMAGSLHAQLGGAMGRQEPTLGLNPEGDRRGFEPELSASAGLQGRGAEFDRITDAETLKIAEMFAPEAAKPRPKGFGELIGTVFGRNKPASGEPLRAYQPPSLDALRQSVPVARPPELGQVALRGTARLLQDVLTDFGVHGEVRGIRPGPVVTEFEFELALGTRASRVISLADDIARAMDAASARITAAPGGTVVSIELANIERQSILLRDVFEHPAFRETHAALPLAIGTTSVGGPAIFDLTVLRHVLVAGGRACGQQSTLKSMALSLVYSRGPADFGLLLIDPEGQALGALAGLPHLIERPVTDPAHGVAALGWLAAQVEDRVARLAMIGARTREDYNMRIHAARRRGEAMIQRVQVGYHPGTREPLYEERKVDGEPMPSLVAVVSELADLMAVGAPDVEDALQVLSMQGAEVGIHLVAATERPSISVLTDAVRHSLPTVIALRTASRSDSRIILGETGAEQLLGVGDMLVAIGGSVALRVHGAAVTDAEIARVVEQLCPGAGEANGNVGVERPTLEEFGAEPMPAVEDGRYEKAYAIAVRSGRVSAFSLAQRLGVDRGEAMALLVRLQSNGVVGPADASGWYVLRDQDATRMRASA